MNQNSQQLDELERTTLARIEQGAAQMSLSLRTTASGPGGPAAAQSFTYQMENWYAGFALTAQQLATAGRPQVQTRVNGLIDEIRKVRQIYANIVNDDRQTDMQIEAMQRAQATAEFAARADAIKAQSDAVHASTQKFLGKG